MGTRGAMGFRLQGVDTLTYNHFDSYPEGLGADMVTFVRANGGDIPDLREKVGALRVVDMNDTPDAELVAKARELDLMDLGVGNQSETDMYCVLRKAQGDLGAYLAVGVIPDGSEFIRDSLFCEYAYIVNLDDETLEFYRGFNQDPNAPGRYAAAQRDREFSGDDYFGVQLVGTLPIADIVSSTPAALAWSETFYPEDSDDDE